MKKPKRVLAIILTIVICVAAAAGVTVAVRETTSAKTVIVIPADTLNYGWYFGDTGNTVDGKLATDASQNIYVTDAQTIEKVYVAEGDKVKKGDLLLTYDTEQAEIALERRQVQLDQIRLEIDVAQRNLDTLHRLYPISEGGIPEKPEKEIPKAPPYQVLDENSIPFNLPSADMEEPSETGNTDAQGSGTADEGEVKKETIPLGTMAYPYRYLVYGDREITVRKSFLTTLITRAAAEGKGYYYVTLEAHENNDPDGMIARNGTAYVLFDAMKLQNVRGDMVLNFTDAEPVLREKEEAETVSVTFMVDSVLWKKAEVIKDEQLIQSEYTGENAPVKEGAKFKEWLDKDDNPYDFTLHVLEDMTLYASWEEKEPTETPTPEPTETPTPEPTETPTPEPTETPTPEPTETPTPEPTETPTPEPTETPTPEPTQEPTPDPTPDPSADPGQDPSADPGNGTDGLQTSAGSEQQFMMAKEYRPVKPLRGKVFDSSGSNSSNSSNSGSSSIGSGLRLIPPNAQYTSKELKQAIQDQEKELKSLQLDERENILKLQLEEKAVKEGEVYAKMDGVVRKAGDPDNLPTDGSAFMQITNSDGLFVQGNISETMLNTTHEGDSVTVQSWKSGMSYQAEITEISPYPSGESFQGFYDSDANASAYPFLACISDSSAEISANDSLRINFSGTQEEEEPSDQGDVLYLYRAFILDEDGKRYVYKRGADNLLEKQEIEVGEISGEGYRIISGVTMQDYLAFPYGKEVQEGAKTREGTLDELTGS